MACLRGDVLSLYLTQAQCAVLGLLVGRAQCLLGSIERSHGRDL